MSQTLGETSGLRILVVDDHEEVLELVGRALKKDGHDVRAVSSNRDAREALVGEWPQVLVPRQQIFDPGDRHSDRVVIYPSA